MDADFAKGIATALIVGVIGPLLWLGIDVLVGKFGLWANRGAKRWTRQESPAKHYLFKYLAGFWAIGQKRLF